LEGEVIEMKRYISLLIIVLMLASTISMCSAFSVSEYLPNQKGTFTWEDNSDCIMNKYIYGGYGRGKWIKIGSGLSSDSGSNLFLNDFDDWFKTHDSAYARYYYEIVWTSETAATQKYDFYKGDNITIKTNSKNSVGWIEVWKNGNYLGRADA
jgi:hypothetical protein